METDVGWVTHWVYLYDRGKIREAVKFANQKFGADLEAQVQRRAVGDLVGNQHSAFNSHVYVERTPKNVARDIVRETMDILSEAASRPKGTPGAISNPHKIIGWLRRVARNRCNFYYGPRDFGERIGGRRVTVVNDIEQDEEGNIAHSKLDVIASNGSVIESATHPEILQLIAHLSGMEREVVIHFADNPRIKSSEVATSMKIPVTRVYNARQRIQAKAKKYAPRFCQLFNVFRGVTTEQDDRQPIKRQSQGRCTEIVIAVPETPIELEMGSDVCKWLPDPILDALVTEYGPKIAQRTNQFLNQLSPQHRTVFLERWNSPEMSAAQIAVKTALALDEIGDALREIRKVMDSVLRDASNTAEHQQRSPEPPHGGTYSTA